MNVPGESVTCRCEKAGYVMQNGKCTKKDGNLFKISGLKLDQTYKDTFKNKNSAAFKSKAAEIENILRIVVCQKIPGCILINVLAINEGSIIVDYSVILAEEYKNITKDAVLEVARNALHDERMIVLRVDGTSILSAQSRWFVFLVDD